MANREMRSSLKRWISAVAWFLRAWTLAGFACVDGMGAVWGGPRVDVWARLFAGLRPCARGGCAAKSQIFWQSFFSDLTGQLN